MKSETVKVLEENIGGTLHDIDVRQDFLNRAPFSQELKLTIDRWDLMKLRIFCIAKEIIN